MSLLAQAVIAALIFAAGAASGIKFHAGQDAIKENARIELVREQERAHRATERQQATNVTEAVNEARKRESAARVAASVARTELDGLRNETAAIRANLPTATLDACRERAATLSELFDQCGAAYQELARKADGHAGDTVTLERAWPK